MSHCVFWEQNRARNYYCTDSHSNLINYNNFTIGSFFFGGRLSVVRPQFAGASGLRAQLALQGVLCYVSVGEIKCGGEGRQVGGGGGGGGGDGGDVDVGRMVAEVEWRGGM